MPSWFNLSDFLDDEDREILTSALGKLSSGETVVIEGIYEPDEPCDCLDCRFMTGESSVN
jgi:hypothetical protein